MILTIWKRGECLRAMAVSVAVTCLMYLEKYCRTVKNRLAIQLQQTVGFFFPLSGIGILGRVYLGLLGMVYMAGICKR